MEEELLNVAKSSHHECFAIVFFFISVCTPVHVTWYMLVTIKMHACAGKEQTWANCLAGMN